MALDHRRLISGKKNQANFFAFDKFTQQIWLRVNQPFIPFTHHIMQSVRDLYDKNSAS